MRGCAVCGGSSGRHGRGRQLLSSCSWRRLCSRVGRTFLLDRGRGGLGRRGGCACCRRISLVFLGRGGGGACGGHGQHSSRQGCLLLLLAMHHVVQQSLDVLHGRRPRVRLAASQCCGRCRRCLLSSGGGGGGWEAGRPCLWGLHTRRRREIDTWSHTGERAAQAGQSTRWRPPAREATRLPPWHTTTCGGQASPLGFSHWLRHTSQSASFSRSNQWSSVPSYVRKRGIAMEQKREGLGGRNSVPPSRYK